MTYNTISDGVTMLGGEGTLLANRYRIVRQLGQGGMGSVWLAEDTQLDNKPFAIKMLPSILVSNKRAYRQLKDEALVAMRLVHPNIVQIRAFEENNGNPFLVMDYIDGQSLDDCLEEWGTLTPGQTVTLLRPVAAALDYAHRQGVVHRDVKPGNVMVRKDGVPFVLDFGIAREIQETMTRVTGKFSSGTLLYMSPEQLNGDAPRPAQDIYSFAAMAYECLKGEPPFSHGQIEFQIMNKAPEPLVGGPHSCAQAIMLGLAKTPEGRPATCAGVLSVGDAVPRPNVVARRTATRVVVQRLIAAVAGVLLVAAGIWCLVGDGTSKKGLRSTVPQPAPVSTPPKVPPSNEDGSAVNGIWSEAGLQKDALEYIPGDDGFQEEKHKLFKNFDSAKRLYDGKQWSDAAVALTNFVEDSKALLKLNEKRNVAKSSRRDADSARKLAKDAEAEHHARELWQMAEKLHHNAAKKFGWMEFDEAAKGFELAKHQFEMCATEAERLRKEREREAAEYAEKQAEEALKRQQELFRQAHERKLSEVEVGSVVEMSAETGSKRGLVIENASRNMSIRCTRGNTAVTYKYPYDQIKSIEVITRGNGVVPKAGTSSGSGAPTSAEAPRKESAAPTVTQHYAYEARFVPFIIEGGMKRYVSAVPVGDLPSGVSVRQESKNGRFEIVIGTSRRPEEIIRLTLSNGGRYKARTWVSVEKFNSNPVEIELK